MVVMETQQEKVQVCTNNWVRWIVGVKRIDKRRMEELREEVGVRESHEEAGGRESHEEAGEEPAKVGWTCGKNGRGTIDEERGCAWSGR